MDVPVRSSESFSREAAEIIADLREMMEKTMVIEAALIQEIRSQKSETDFYKSDERGPPKKKMRLLGQDAGRGRPGELI
jgi:hypothetical protein